MYDCRKFDMSIRDSIFVSIAQAFASDLISKQDATGSIPAKEVEHSQGRLRSAVAAAHRVLANLETSGLTELYSVPVNLAGEWYRISAVFVNPTLPVSSVSIAGKTYGVNPSLNPSAHNSKPIVRVGVIDGSYGFTDKTSKGKWVDFDLSQMYQVVVEFDKFWLE